MWIAHAQSYRISGSTSWICSPNVAELDKQSEKISSAKSSQPSNALNCVVCLFDSIKYDNERVRPHACTTTIIIYRFEYKTPISINATAKFAGAKTTIIICLQVGIENCVVFKCDWNGNMWQNMKLLYSIVWSAFNIDTRMKPIETVINQSNKI